MEETTIRLADLTLSRLQALAEWSGRSRDDLIDEALTRFPDEQGVAAPRLPSFVGAFAVGGDAGADKRRLREDWKRQIG